MDALCCWYKDGNQKLIYAGKTTGNFGFNCFLNAKVLKRKEETKMKIVTSFDVASRNGTEGCDYGPLYRSGGWG